MLEATYKQIVDEFTQCGQGAEEETMRVAKYFYDNPTATYESCCRELDKGSLFGVWFRLQHCLPEIHPRAYETIKDNLADMGLDIEMHPKLAEYNRYIVQAEDAEITLYTFEKWAR